MLGAYNCAEDAHSARAIIVEREVVGNGVALLYLARLHNIIKIYIYSCLWYTYPIVRYRIYSRHIRHIRHTLGLI